MDEPNTPKPKLTLCQRLAVLMLWHKQCVAHFSTDNAKKERHAEFAAIAEDARSFVCKKDKQPPTYKPTLPEVLLYASELGLPELEGHKFFNYFEAAGWKMSGRTKIKNWQARLKNWQADYKERAETRRGGQARKDFNNGF